uniref:Exocyst complex component 7 n=1 Tax=Gorilla gorilla gorilla TaxID=9595 RepID=A0A2I2Z897_GORGO
MPKVSILSSFESRLMKLENSIIPVHKQTENLQRLQENVEKTLSCLDHVISYYHVASDTEKIIREGPTGRLEEYLGSMAKIQKAVEYFQDNSPDSPELNKVKLLFERGKEALESEFRSLMTRHSKVVSPVLILDLISGDDDLEAQEDVALETSCLASSPPWRPLVPKRWRTSQTTSRMTRTRSTTCRRTAPCTSSPAMPSSSCSSFWTSRRRQVPCWPPKRPALRPPATALSSASGC